MRAARIAAALVVTGLTGVLPAEAPGPDPELIAQAQAVLAEDYTRLQGVTITPEMRENATFDLRLVESNLGFDTVVEDEGHTTVRLSADLLFEFGQAALTDEASTVVAELAQDIPQGAAVAVDGHTDSVGDAAANDTLSRQRGDAVAAALAQARPDLALTVTGHGAAQPVAENEVDGHDNPAGRALNRRVEVTYETSE
ncbi:OmpA family protein [Xylanimonas allomyrinae]|uniref:OmpA family protein n=1 Tax=Xylanimonas allomyrinae TaxID=2509459 RepID=A0A4P6ENA9_9MICO|nr:OmpA family protein [Xylanimonas allomyrinae]QAY64370.1 OmpA family protein [Xylanimonas allomyrinae]